MTKLRMNKVALALPALAVFISFLLVACGDGDTGLSRAEVEEIVREEMTDAPAPPEPSPGLTADDVKEAIRRAAADPRQPEVGLSKSGRADSRMRRRRHPRTAGRTHLRRG